MLPRLTAALPNAFSAAAATTPVLPGLRAQSPKDEKMSSVTTDGAEQAAEIGLPRQRFEKMLQPSQDFGGGDDARDGRDERVAVQLC